MQVGEVVDGDQKKEFLITGSRDKSLMIWDIQEKGDADADKEWGVPRKIFKGKQWISSYMSFLNRPLSLRQRSRFVSGQQTWFAISLKEEINDNLWKESWLSSYLSWITYFKQYEEFVDN